ncbi:MAG: FGGY-family carbohydrate kinase [Holophaga sp.]|nr:FGGY-family carbohydrate kinase [Holophaga sp.]
MSQASSSNLQPPFILAVDLGTSGCKTALVSLDGQVAAWAFAAVPLRILPGNGAEQAPADWWQAFLDTARQVLTAAEPRSGQVAAICCSCQGEGTIPVDRDGRELANAILWLDMRGRDAIRQRVRGKPNIAGYGAAKLARWLRFTGGAPSLSGKDPAAHMLFIQETWPEIFGRTHKFLNVLDYLNLRLTGRMVSTFDSVLTSWVTDNRDVDRIHYHPGLLRQLGIDRSLFPDLVPCTEVIGTLRPDVAETLGLAATTPVVAGAVDNTAAAVGSGQVADFAAHLYIGNSSWIGAHVPFKKTQLLTEVASLPCALPGRYLMVALQSTAGASLAFLKDQVIYHKDELLKEAQAPDVYKILDRIAEGVPAGSRGLLFTPWLFGERTPVSDPTLRGGLFNLSLEHNRSDIVRAVLEGVALNTRWMLAPSERFLGRKIEELTIIGGGGCSSTWCQIFADALGIRIRQPQEPMQANAVGAAWIAAAGLGLAGFQESAAQVRVRATFLPDPARHLIYDELFGRFRELHRRLSPFYRRINNALAQGGRP